MPYSTREGSARIRRWTRKGAIIGLLMAAIDFMFPSWLDHATTVPWISPDGATENLGYLVAAVIGCALLFRLAAVVANVFIGGRERRR